MPELKPEGRFWTSFAILTSIVLLIATTRWMFDHPYGISWDEAGYFNTVLIDIKSLHDGGLHSLGRSLLHEDTVRPPAYRVLAIPFLVLFGFRTVTARLISLAFFGLSLLFVYLATRRIASPAAGAFAVLFLCLSPEIVFASMLFYTEYPLYVAISAMMLFLVLLWSGTTKPQSCAIGLGVAFALGFLSRTTFLLILPPVMVVALLLPYLRDYAGVKPALLLKAAILGCLLAAPWWWFNFKDAISYARYAMNFSRGTLGPPSLKTWAIWLSTIAQGLLGYCLTLLVVIVLLIFLVKTLKRKINLDPLQRIVLIASACVAAPLLVSEMIATNPLLRHLSPILFPLAVAFGVMTHKTGWTRSGTPLVISSILFSLQLIMIVSPVVRPNTLPVDNGLINGRLPWRVMLRKEQWNWEPLRGIGIACGVGSPVISFLGLGSAFNSPQINFPWAVHEEPFVEARWLWRNEQGPIQWEKIMGSLDSSDMVLTAPHYLGDPYSRDDIDNMHNADFAERLSRDFRFREPIHLGMGRFEPVDLLVFVKKALVCSSTRAGNP